MEWLIGLAALVIGALFGAMGVILFTQARRNRVQSDLSNAQARATLLDQQVHHGIGETRAIRDELGSAHQAREAAQRQAAVLTEQLQTKQKQFEEQRQLLEGAEKKLTDTFKAVGADALRHNNQQFIELAKGVFEKLMTQASGDVEKKQLAIDNLIKPIKELLEKQNAAVTEIEKKREVAYKGIEEQIKVIGASHADLRNETGRLVTALRRPEVRGRWGEVQLRLVVELAGMTRHCDFNEQVTVWKDDQASRPDLIVNLPGGGAIPVDSKVALDAYEQAMQPDADREALLKRHAKQVSDHVNRLADKKYWEALERSPRVVVLFISPESAFVAALEMNPDLQRDAMSQNVLLATPTTLLALLRAVAYGWQQDALAANAKQISQVGQELYERLAKFVDGFSAVGERIGSAAAAYNKSIGTLEARVLSSARRLKELNATADDEIDTPPPIDIEIRPIVMAELKSKSGDLTLPPAELPQEALLPLPGAASQD